MYTYCVYVYAIDSESASEIGSERQMSGDGDDSVSRSNKRKRGAEDRSRSGMYCYAQCFMYAYCVHVYAIDSEGASRICSVRRMRGDGDDSVSKSNKRKRVLKDRNYAVWYVHTCVCNQHFVYLHDDLCIYH